MSSSDVYSNEGVQELNSGIKEEQFEDDTDIIDNSAHNDVKKEKVKLMEEKSDINCFEFPRIHKMESESFNPDALEIETKDDLIEDSSEKSAFINKVHKQLIQQSVLAKQAKLQCKCKECGVQSTNLNWFAKHVAEHQQENLPSLKESVLKLKKSGLKIKEFGEKSVLKIRPKILQSSSIVNEPDSIVNEHESKSIANEAEPILNESNEVLMIDSQTQEFSIMENLSCHPMIKQEAPETNNNSKKLEELGIFVKAETYIKPEIIFGISDSDSNHAMSIVSDDPLAVHTDKRHLEVARKMNYKCSICSYLFSQKTALENHYFRFHDIKNHDITVYDRVKQYKCKESEYKARQKLFKRQNCDFETAEKENLQKHIDSLHKEIKELKCSFCDFETAQNSILKRHIESVHKEIKPFKCGICDYECAQKGNLKRHVESVHERIKPFKCNICGYETVLKAHLKKHIEFVHEGIKPFKCNICNYECAAKAVLKQHIESVHEGIKPFKCHICDYECARNGTLKRHTKSVHN